MLKNILASFFILLEIPFLVKCIKAHQQCELSREIAIIIIMLIISLIIFAIFMIG